MVSPSKPHHSRVASQEHLHKCKLVKGPKPLTHFRFYLDIEKHHIENKIEKTIRELGGSIEFFLAKTVTHFVTDKPIDRDGNLLNVSSHYLSPASLLLSQAKTPSPAPKSSSIQSLNDLNISDDKAACSRPRSRADAMVQRARTTTQPVSPLENKVQCASSQSLLPNPVQLAQKWGIPIWNAEYTLKFLDKVSLALKLENQARTTSSTKSSHHHHHKTANVKHLKGDYIKIESTQKHYRPYYQEFSSWPKINFNCNLCPFQNKSEKTAAKTKNCDEPKSDDSKSTKLSVKPATIGKTIGTSIAEVTGSSVPISVLAKNEEKCGYCEKCRVEYDVLALHLQSKEHMNFVKNNDNYIALDSLINSSTNVEKFLRINSGQIIDEPDRNGMHSPKSMISTRMNYLSHGSFTGVDKDDAKHKQMNGVIKHEVVSPPKLNSIRDRLPKYSPPITRRSQTKNSGQVAQDDNQTTNTNVKCHKEKLNSVIVDFNEDEVNFISKADNESPTKSPKTKATINGKKKCDEPTNAVIDDSPVLPKRLVRAFPRYKVMDEGKTERVTKTKSPSKVELADEKDLLDGEKGIKDPITGLIVKFKRVRESELSKLTYEADNFMFPKREEMATDEDRQSTSEPDGDASSELLSSEVSGMRDSFSTTANSSLNVSTASEQFTSTGRRKKRRSQYDTFKSPATSRQKFRSSLIQSRLNPNKTTTANGSQTLAKQPRRSAKLSAAKIRAATARRPKKQRVVVPTVVPETPIDNTLDDRMGENSYIGGKLLATDYFQNLKFSFERVPNNEPWYSTFQRQDENRERMFEYWGNTVYRKLPYELGPLPPLSPDCCLLSKLTAMKSTKQPKRRSVKTSVSVEATNSKLPPTIEEEPVSVSNSTNRPATPPNVPKPVAISLPNEEIGNDKRATSSTLSQLLLADSSLSSISLPAAISNKKKTMLLDKFGKPRKSPREHASTLAILSSLVQQRRKRIKDMNGGLSPEKMPSYKAAVAAALAAQHSADASESEDITDECDSRLHIKAAIETELKPMSSRRRSNQTPVFEVNKSSADGSDPNSGGYHSMEPSDKIFRLRKGKRRQTESVSSNNESISGKNEKVDEAAKGTKEIDTPKMPIDEYVDPNKLARELDEMLSNCCLDADRDLNDIPIDCSDLILVNSSKDFLEIIESVKEGPLTYRSLQRGKKRHINKTGWPSLPRKRLPKREKVDDVESALSDVQNCESGHSDTENDLNDMPMDCENDSSNHVIDNTLKRCLDDGVESTKDSPIPFRSVPRGRRRNTNKTDDDHDDDKSKVLRQDRRRIRTPFCDDNAVQFAVSASSSEKAENSDIFNLSSDSFLDGDVNNDTITTAKSRLSADSRNSIEDDGSMSDETTVNNDASWHCRDTLRSNSITDDVLKQDLASPSIEETAASTGTSILERTLKNMSTRSKFLRSPTLTKDTQIDMNLQPLVCVQKMSDKDIPQKHWINNLSPVTSNQEIEIAKPNNRPSPKTKTSPRKLRKPRGRWYRER